MQNASFKQCVPSLSVRHIMQGTCALTCLNTELATLILVLLSPWIAPPLPCTTDLRVHADTQQRLAMLNVCCAPAATTQQQQQQRTTSIRPYNVQKCVLKQCVLSLSVCRIMQGTCALTSSNTLLATLITALVWP